MKITKYLSISVLIAALAVISIMLVGCAEEPEPAEEPAGEAAEAPPAEAETAEEPPAEAPEPPKPAAKVPSAKALTNPSGLKAKAPENFRVKFATSKGDVLIDVTRSWAPIGADRFYNLVTNGFYDGCKFFRIVPNFIAQVGMSPDPRISKIWQNATIKDDPVTKTNRKGSLTFAKTSFPNSRTAQLFINLKANEFLDNQGFAPFGTVVEGMDAIESLYAGYGEGPDQEMIRAQGNKYLEGKFPKLDYIETATVLD